MTKKQQFIQKNKGLFWSTKSYKQISDQALTETILNYGDIPQIKKLFDIIGYERVKNIFFTQMKQKRNNYQKSTAYFFKNYFQKW